MRRLASFGLPLLVFAAGLAVGAWFSRSRGAPGLSSGSGLRLAGKADAAAVSATKADARAFSTDEEMLTAIMSAVAEEEPLLRAHRLHDLLGRLSTVELATLFDRTTGIADRDRRSALFGALLGRWAALDPAGAAAAVRPFRERFRAGAQEWRGVESAVDAGWSQAQPDAALAEALAAPDATWARSTAWTALQTLADGDPAQQLEKLAGLPASRLRDGMCENSIKALAEKDTAAAEARLALLSEPRQRAGVQAEILGRLAQRDPAAGLARLAALAPELTASMAGTRLVSTVLRAVAKKDPAGALAAVDGVPEDLHTPALGAALVGWAGEQPIEVLNWAAANGVDIADTKAAVYYGSNGYGGWNSLLSAALDGDRAKALSWLRAQPASPARDDMLREGLWRGTAEERFAIYSELSPRGRIESAEMVVDSLYRTDPQRAEAWAKAQPAGPARQNAISSLASEKAGNVPDQLEALVAAWPAGAERDAALRGISWSFYSDPQRALEYARRVGSATMREELLERAARSWSYRDAPGARAWLTSTREITAEQKRVLLRELEER